MIFNPFSYFTFIIFQFFYNESIDFPIKKHLKLNWTHSLKNSEEGRDFSGVEATLSLPTPGLSPVSALRWQEEGQCSCSVARRGSPQSPVTAAASQISCCPGTASAPGETHLDLGGLGGWGAPIQPDGAICRPQVIK